MAVTIVASFTLIIPIEGLIWLFALPSGLLIGYYANQRSNRRAGPWRRIFSNGLFAAFATGRVDGGPAARAQGPVLLRATTATAIRGSAAPSPARPAPTASTSATSTPTGGPTWSPPA